MKKHVLKRFLLPALGIGGVLYGLTYATTSSTPKVLPEKQVGLPLSSNYSRAISGSGLIEANTRNIDIGSHVSGIVSEIFVTEGDLVEKDAPLFRIDDRTAKADIVTAESNLTVARAQLAEAQVSYADQQDQLKRVQGLKEGFAVTADRVTRLKFALRTAASRVEVAKASLDEAEAQLKAANVALTKLTVTSPIKGRVLRLSMRAGEFLQAGAAVDAPIVVGNDTPLHARVSLDENDLWRFRKDAKATGALRSNRDVTFPLTFVRLEPYVVPKKSLTGATSERVDTRVLEVVYRVDATDVPVYIGQQVDVFIDASDAPAAKAETAVTPEPAPAPTPAPVAEPVPVTPVMPEATMVPEVSATPTAPLAPVEPTPPPAGAVLVPESEGAAPKQVEPLPPVAPAQ